MTSSPSTHLRQHFDFWLVLACFFLSGWAALVYQTVWMRQFAVVFGTSELAISTVLAAYMAGLALGAALASRWAHRITHPVWAYGLLELGIALGALMFPLGLWFSRELQTWCIGGQSQLPDAGGLAQPLFYVSVAFVLLMIPTTCMGATLPLLTRYAVQTNDQVGRRVGALYSINTLGAVLGTLMAGFLILPTMGLFETTLLGILANVGVFLIAWQLERRQTDLSSTAAEPAAEAETPEYGIETLILPIMLVSGAISFTYEVMWSRLLGQVLGGSVYAFSTMLASFLTGITLGSALASRFAKSRSSSVWMFAGCQIMAAVMSMVVYSSLDSVPALAKSLGAGASDGTMLWANSLLAGLVLLPSTIFIGATYPFAVRILADSATDASSASGRVYSWNTVGSVAGALLAGFWILPTFEFTGTIMVCVSASFLLALACMVISPATWTYKTAMACPCAIALALFSPQSPENILSMSPLMTKDLEGDVIFQKVGRSSTVRLTNGNGFYLLQNNGLPEAIIGKRGTPPFGGGLHRWLTALPIVARPEAESLLVIGFGGGIAVDNVPGSVRTIDVIELEPEVIEANRLISSLRDYDPLSDPRTRVVENDARGALALSSRTYDIIVSQPSHPWTAGASHLYTREFHQLAKSRLAEGGVFLQWLNADFLDEELFKITASTLLSVFENVRLYQPTSTALFFLASDEAVEPESSLLSTGEPLVSHGKVYSRLPINSINDLLATLTMDTDGLRTICRGVPPNTDNRNRLAFEARPAKQADGGASLRKLLQSLDPLTSKESRVQTSPELLKAMKPGIVARRLCVLEMWERAQTFAAQVRIPSERSFTQAVVARSEGDVQRTRALLRQALSFDPQHAEAKFLLCEQFLNELLAHQAPVDVLKAYHTLPAMEKAVLDATLALQRDDFSTMAQLEQQLAEVPIDHVAHVFALYARAGWRAVPSQDSQRWMRAEEAIELVDQAMSIWRRSQGHMMRINAAMLADQPFKAVETARHYAMEFEHYDPSKMTDARNHLPVLERVASHLEDDIRLRGHQVESITRFIKKTAGQYQPATSSTILPASFQQR